MRGRERLGGERLGRGVPHELTRSLIAGGDAAAVALPWSAPPRASAGRAARTVALSVGSCIINAMTHSTTDSTTDALHALSRECLPDDHPLWGEEFQEALWGHFEGTEHRIGGHANPVQDDVETEVARGALGSPPWDDPRIKEEALRWLLLAQFDTDDDADMMWGDVGALYWLIRPEDLAERRFDRAMFTWQCG